MDPQKQQSIKSPMVPTPQQTDNSDPGVITPEPYHPTEQVAQSQPSIPASGPGSSFQPSATTADPISSPSFIGAYATDDTDITKSSHRFPLFVWVIIAITVGLGGWFGYKYLISSNSGGISLFGLENKTTQKTKTTTSKPGTATKSAPALDPIANWKIYPSSSNINYASFRYPSDWILAIGAQGVSIKSPDFKSESGNRVISSGSILTVVHIDKAESPLSLDEVYADPSSTAKQYITLGGVKAIKSMLSGSTDQNSSLEVYAISNGNAYGLYQSYKLNSDNPYPTLADDVAKTFVFN
ncbi:MAG: hypothetical protein WCK26_02830 [Candidatus Saccharibacteria bacterium]